MSHTLWGIKTHKKKTKKTFKKIARTNLKQKLVQEKKFAFRSAENFIFLLHSHFKLSSMWPYVLYGRDAQKFDQAVGCDHP